MSHYHDANLELLGLSTKRRREKVLELEAWAQANGIELPAAYLEWAQLDRGLLHKYSNQDYFWFKRPKLETLSDGRRGLVFNSENQNNFFKLLLLDHGDNPPVLFSFCREPWSEHAERFSDCVYSQIFDWQYQLKFSKNRDIPDMQYSGFIQLSGQRCVDELRASFSEAPATWISMEGWTSPEYRFFKSPRERMTVMLGSDGGSTIRVYAENFVLTKSFEGQLLDMFSQDIVPQQLYSPHTPKDLLETLATHIDNGWLTHIHHLCINRPTEAAVKRLIECHKRAPLPEHGKLRRRYEIEIGDSECGVIVRFQKADKEPHYTAWWRIQEILEY